MTSDRPPVNPMSIEEMTLGDVGTTLLSERRYEEAIVVFHEVVRRDPSDGMAWLLLGQAYSQIGRMTEARAALCLAQLNQGPFMPVLDTRMTRAVLGEDGEVAYDA